LRRIHEQSWLGVIRAHAFSLWLSRHSCSAASAFRSLANPAVVLTFQNTP
jgi:hypothetical protein